MRYQFDPASVVSMTYEQGLLILLIYCCHDRATVRICFLFAVFNSEVFEANAITSYDTNRGASEVSLPGGNGADVYQALGCRASLAARDFTTRASNTCWFTSASFLM
jgi:hypothetical protein